ncbi:MAG: GGDEF domain-containing protein [Proteobacteria bacterium]|nr:GGDEF domain-containing protein [Pseudomonadota bacterium]MBU1611919.1 GGDEF domain-containing protein [Pseudomonadota bacterium]
MQKLIVDTLRAKEYTDERYQELVLEQEEILLAPHKEKIQLALDETQALMSDVQRLLLRKKGDVQSLETTAVDLVESGGNPKNLISSMRKAFQEVVNSMEQDMKDLTELSMTDQLTKLRNRRAFDQCLEQAVSSAMSDGTPLSLVMIDIDHFKLFNDTYGHRVGDQALQVVSRALLKLGEEINAGGEIAYQACRYGGEEFTVILPGANGPSGAQVAEEIRKRIERCALNIEDKFGKLLHERLSITVSLGVQELDPNWNGAYVSNLVEQADKKLYFAKETGRNRVCHQLDS